MKCRYTGRMKQFIEPQTDKSCRSINRLVLLPVGILGSESGKPALLPGKSVWWRGFDFPTRILARIRMRWPPSDSERRGDCEVSRGGGRVGEDKARVGEHEQTLEMCIFPIGDLLAQAKCSSPCILFLINYALFASSMKYMTHKRKETLQFTHA
jgi:hypothetical protein